MLDVLDRFSTISDDFEIVIVHEGLSPMSNDDTPMRVSEH